MTTITQTNFQPISVDQLGLWHCLLLPLFKQFFKQDLYILWFKAGIQSDGHMEHLHSIISASTMSL